MRSDGWYEAEGASLDSTHAKTLLVTYRSGIPGRLAAGSLAHLVASERLAEWLLATHTRDLIRSDMTGYNDANTLICRSLHKIVESIYTCMDI